MDCEGCEYALARSILLDDPDFLGRLGQLAIEVHVSRAWAKDARYAVHLGALFSMLQMYNFTVASVQAGSCNERDAAHGCDETLAREGVCAVGRMCNNMLFVRSM